MRKEVSLLLVTGAVLAVGACAPAEDPKVTFFAAGKSVEVSPTQYCDVKVENCKAKADAAGALRVPTGQEVKVSVDPRIGETPWQVVFRYRQQGDEPGKSVDGRSEVFAPGKQLAYSLKLPEATSQLETVEVHQFGAALSARDDGGFDFGTRGTWVLSVDDRG
ncbi:hypothetical protein JOF53_003889 [Crossiella equi]|uniref:DUF2771 family protein n=1 Tax=Crossiella equi TaxID=130796 RepID=A0ABS5AFB9_9PSEU|nr:DUF2771 family protein [Crossiella equi]MBP2475017.1 hypothetical protein [Crossiella equi]